MSNLATPYDIARTFPQAPTNDPTLMGAQLGLVEETLFVQQLGTEFHDALKADVQVHEYVNYVESGAYTVGEKVLHKGLVYQCIQDANSGTGIYNVEHWKLADKFTQAEYNHIWETYLLPAISYRVMAAVMPYKTVKATDKGLQINSTELSKAADRGQMNAATNKMVSDSDGFLILMDRYIQGETKKDLAVFANYKPIKDSNELRARRKRRRSRNGFII